jgi:diguanylate cyclase (GGDEF)-like protein
MAGIGGEPTRIDLTDRAPETGPERLGALVEVLADGVLLIDGQGHLERLNAAARTWLGPAAAAAMEGDPSRWLTHLDLGLPSGSTDPHGLVGRLLAGDPVTDLRLEATRPDGVRAVLVNGRPLPPEAGGGAVILVRDVTEEVEHADALRREARRDPLTDLPNRRAFSEAIVGAGTSDMVVLVDLDRFKPVNDHYGHHVGDMVLLTLGARLRVGIRAGDIAARVGGDEFAVLSRRVHDDEAAELVERIRTVLERPVEIEGILLQVGASIGVTRIQASDDPTEIIRRADQAMYEDKRLRLLAGLARTGPADGTERRGSGMRGTH